MGSVNAQMNPAQLQSTLQNFEMESSKMDMKEEMSKLSKLWLLDSLLNEWNFYYLFTLFNICSC